MVVQEEEGQAEKYRTGDYQHLAASLRPACRKVRPLAHRPAGLRLIVTIYYIGLRLLGVQGALVLAILGGFTEFIPYLGPILGGIPAVLVALSQSPTLAFITLILYVAVQQAENHILVPKVMQKAVGLNPVLSIVALLVGGKLFGIPGAILAIPVATACSVAVKEIFRFQREREMK